MKPVEETSLGVEELKSWIAKLASATLFCVWLVALFR